MQEEELLGMSSSARTGGVLGYVSLFTSLGTLLCCALPSLLVLLGLGATVASVVSTAPWLINLSRHKIWTFTIAGLLIAANFVYVFRIAPKLQATRQSCPVDQPSACGTASRVSRTILWVSAGIYLVGFFAAYLLAPILRVLE
jgi:mercuric ion transport protein